MMWKMIFGGVGGQGVITAAILLGEAVVVHEGRWAVQTQSYTAQARGGPSRADITIADEETYFPKVRQAHLLVCMHQMAYTKYLRYIRPGGILIAESDHVEVGRNVDARFYDLPLARTVQEHLGSWRSANIAMLGAVVGITEAARPESVRIAIRERFGSGTDAVTAFDLGLKLVENRGPDNR